MLMSAARACGTSGRERELREGSLLMLLLHPKETSMSRMRRLFLRKGEHFFGQEIAGGVNTSKFKTFMEGLIKE